MQRLRACVAPATTPCVRGGCKRLLQWTDSKFEAQLHRRPVQRRCGVLAPKGKSNCFPPFQFFNI
eukprot:scaffold1343_cov217-Pinguiococcus_pyrenoidosus.AAC.2